MTSNKSESYYIIANKFAGHGKGAIAVEKILQYFNEKRINAEYVYTENQGHAVELAKNASRAGFKVVVAVGGDGTVNEVAQGLAGTLTTLGIIPVGSGNGLARELKIPMNLKNNIDTLINGRANNIDICRLNSQQFLCTSGIGFDALVAHKMSKSKTRGLFKYVQLVIQESIFFKPVKVKMIADKVEIERNVFLITFANASQFGNNAFIAPNAKATDGLIDLVIVNKFNKLWMPFFSIALFTKLVPKLPFVECFKVTNIELIEAQTPYFHFDGEPGMLELPAKIELDVSKLSVLCGNKYKA